MSVVLESHRRDSDSSSDDNDSDDDLQGLPPPNTSGSDNSTQCDGRPPTDVDWQVADAYSYNPRLRFSTHFILYVCLLCILAFVIRGTLRACARRRDRRRRRREDAEYESPVSKAVRWSASNRPAPKTRPQDVLPVEALRDPTRWARERFRLTDQTMHSGDRAHVVLSYDLVTQEYLATGKRDRKGISVFHGSVPFCYSRDASPQETLLYYEITILSGPPLPSQQDNTLLRESEQSFVVGLTSRPFPRKAHVGNAPHSAGFSVGSSLLQVCSTHGMGESLVLPEMQLTFPITFGFGLYVDRWSVVLTMNGDWVQEVPLGAFSKDVELVPAVSVDQGEWVWKVRVDGDYAWKGADGCTVIAAGLEGLDSNLPRYVP